MSYSNSDNELTRLLSVIKSYELKAHDLPEVEYEHYLDLFKNPTFIHFTRQSPLIVAVYNFTKQKYEFVSESILELYGTRPEEFTVEYGAQAFIELMKPQSLEIMISEITPNMLEHCIKFRDQSTSLRFTACLEIKSKNNKEGWVLLNTHILSIDSNGFPILSCTTGMDVTAIKKDPFVYYSASLLEGTDTTILYSKNMTGTKTPVKFSKREIQIIQYLCQGATTREIADKLFLSFDTIKKQRSNILDKSGTRNTAELINFSTMTGII